MIPFELTYNIWNRESAIITLSLIPPSGSTIRIPKIPIPEVISRTVDCKERIMNAFHDARRLQLPKLDPDLQKQDDYTKNEEQQSGSTMFLNAYLQNPAVSDHFLTALENSFDEGMFLDLCSLYCKTQMRFNLWNPLKWLGMAYQGSISNTVIKRLNCICMTMCSIYAALTSMASFMNVTGLYSSVNEYKLSSVQKS